jgi:hypothetical protein
MSAQVVISQLPTGLPLTGLEVLPLVQNGITIQASTQAIANLSFGGAVVSSFNTRTGAVSLLATDVTTALGYTPGSVTSVSGTGTVSGLTLSGSVTTTGSLTLGGTLVITPTDFGSQPGNYVLAAPNGATGTPTFRALLAADIPTLNQNTTGTSANVTGIVAVVNGGTGTSTPGLVAGTNISITGSWPNQTINSTLSSGTVTNIATGAGLSGGPITTTGTINLATAYGDTVNPYASKNLSFVLAAPSGSSGLPTFRALVASDIPTLNQNTTGTAANVSGVVDILNGGTNATTQQGAINSIAGAVTSGQYLRGNGTNVTMSAIQAADVPTLNQNTTGTAANVTGIVAVANGGSGTATPSLVAGTNITISGSWPNQTITSAGSPFTSPVEINVNSTSSALTINQTGAGNALLVEDSTNPDSTPTVIDQYGNVILGKTSRTSAYSNSLEVNNTATGLAGLTPQIAVFNYSSSTGTAGPWLSFFRYPSGTVGTTADARVGDLLGGIKFYGQQTSGTLFNGSITATAASGLTSVNLSYSAASHSFFGPITTGTWNGTAIGIAYGGTGETTRQAAMDALAGAVTSGQYLRGDGTDVVMSAIQAADVPTLNQNTTGTAANVTGIVAVANGGSGTSTPSLVPGTNVTISGSWPNQTINSSGGGGGSSTITISNKTGAYTVVAGDLATVINCTSGTFTVSLTAAATLGAGFNVTIWNTSSTATDVITIDPNGAETIDGRTTLILRRGEGMQIVCDGTNWQTGNKKVMRGYAENIGPTELRPIVSGSNSIGIGLENTASGNFSLAVGYLASATNTNSYAIGPGTSSTSVYATAFGANSAGGGSQAVTGNGAMALGGSYASGSNSFAAAIADNTSSYGAQSANSIAIGSTCRAANSNAVAIGWAMSATGSQSIAMGGNSSTASGLGAVTFGRSNTSSGERSFTSGNNNLASRIYSWAVGNGARSEIIGKFAYTGTTFAGDGFQAGDSQYAYITLRAATTNATATALTSDGAAAAATNQVILPNNSAFAFTGTVIARQQAAGGSNYAAWEIKGAILRGANAASTVIGTVNINALSATAGASTWAVALTADTTNGGLAITVTGATSINIRWVASVQTSEVIYA